MNISEIREVLIASFKDMVKMATAKIAEWEGGSEYHNPETDTWTAYDDKIGGNVPTVGPGITGQIDGEPIEIGREYPSDEVSGELGSRLKDEWDWISSKMKGTWGDLNANQKTAVISLLHNVGASNFHDTKAYKHLQSGNLEGFAHEAFDPNIGFVRAGGEIIEGLQNRRAHERDLFFTDMSESAF